MNDPPGAAARTEAQPLVTVLTPTYNRALFLPSAIQSVLAQSHQALELIVIDDGSTDETPAVLAAVRDPRLRCIRTAHRGIGAALNAGLAVAAGAFIARLDSDDIWLPSMLADQLAAFAACPDVDVVYGRSQVIDAAGVRQRAYWGHPLRFPDDALRSLLYVDPVCTITAVHRRQVYERAGGYDEDLELGEDAELNLRIALSGRFLFRDAVVALNRRHRDNHTRDLSRFHTWRRTVLDRFYARADVPARAIAARALAYSNLDAEHGFYLCGQGRWRDASAAFASAVTKAPSPVRATARILWFLAKRHLANPQSAR